MVMYERLIPLTSNRRISFHIIQRQDNRKFFAQLCWRAGFCSHDPEAENNPDALPPCCPVPGWKKFLFSYKSHSAQYWRFTAKVAKVQHNLLITYEKKPLPLGRGQDVTRRIPSHSPTEPIWLRHILLYSPNSRFVSVQRTNFGIHDQFLTSQPITPS